MVGYLVTSESSDFSTFTLSNNLGYRWHHDTTGSGTNSGTGEMGYTQIGCAPVAGVSHDLTPATGAAVWVYPIGNS